ncbi:hypothetical protein BIV57_08025 [Mangrovactinospora gilvigrisea]|uniref:Bacterial bifunctional deaminase-reductase C-terminal domain-containing protein n=1 Tax=Mangrovactinospora gilvigrisea TaxID=1428644 RepID=A0A1J7BHF5_9ACTN|nr:dihydrofolate reductase family protein [Mangrovactinospora gilvigrisea]OIV38013.1 hypothetical protein BIV57_08025 [Mangrovactinospora gilvigrisea]
MRQIWPAGREREVDDAVLEELYAYPSERPWAAVNFVSSADGGIEVGGRSRPLSDAADRKIYRLGSDLADVVLLGAGTAVREAFDGIHPDTLAADRRRRHGLAPVPPIAVVTTGRSLPPDAPVLTGAAVPTLVLAPDDVPAELKKAWSDAGAEVVPCGAHGIVDMRRALDALRERGLARVDCEGGPHLFGSLLEAGLVDELRLTIAPLLISGRAGRIAVGATALDPAALTLASALAEGDTLLLRYLL